MANKPDIDFERTIKSSLEGFEDPYNPIHWEEMESRLKLLPKSTAAFKWTFSMNVFVAIIACTAIFYALLNTHTTAPKHMTIHPPQVGPTPVLTVKLPQSTPEQAAQEDSKQTNAEINLVPQAETMQNTYQAPVNTSPAGSINRVLVHPQEPEVSLISPLVPALTNDKNISPESPIFGDMIDPSQGYIYNTREKGRGASDLSNQSSINIGWNNFVFYDPKNKKLDSIKTQSFTPALRKQGEARRTGIESAASPSKNYKTVPFGKTYTDSASALIQHSKEVLPCATTVKDSISQIPEPLRIPKRKKDKSMHDPY